MNYSQAIFPHYSTSLDFGFAGMQGPLAGSGPKPDPIANNIPRRYLRSRLAGAKAPRM